MSSFHSSLSGSSHLPDIHDRAKKQRSQVFSENKEHGRQHSVWRALKQVSSSPFSARIEEARPPEIFSSPRFDVCEERTDPVIHISHYQ